jgi:choline kinase
MTQFDTGETGMHAVILAAGDGGRLRPHTAGIPKPLLPLAGRPIISHVLDGLYAAGITSTTIVIGYRKEQMRATVESLHPCGMQLRFVENDAYMLANARSLWAARDVVHAPFVLAMADHIVDPKLTNALITAAGNSCALAVERTGPTDARASEATRALVRGSYVVDLGKSIADWNALDTGTFYCTSDVFDAITPERRDGELGAVFASLACERKLRAVDVTGLHWIDVDTADDWLLAQDIHAGHMHTKAASGEVA